ncbi:hypothetical protein N7522_011905 [Penicillium canescens]|nr:hypothetical protein N7522_011905 [Penicillium canescens]
MQFEAGISPAANPLWDASGPDGLGVKHDLVIELVITEYICSTRKNKFVTQHCGIDVVRMGFKVCITERGGLGTGSDVEMPPVYEDVPARLPAYSNGDGCYYH